MVADVTSTRGTGPALNVHTFALLKLHVGQAELAEDTHTTLSYTHAAPCAVCYTLECSCLVGAVAALPHLLLSVHAAGWCENTAPKQLLAGLLTFEQISRLIWLILWADTWQPPAGQLLA